MISGLDLSKLNTTFVAQLSAMNFTGKQIFESETLLDDAEAAHKLHQTIKGGFSYSGCFLAEILTF